MKSDEASAGMKKIIVVLGMHRSGTSAITRGLQLLGADLGSELMPGIPGDNDKGFWEDLGIYDINERLLSELGLRWDSLSEIPSERLRSVQFDAMRREATDLLRARTAGARIFAFKDPRTAILLPFWQGIFTELALDDRYLIVIRNPRSVADSLARRNGFDRDQSFYLWMKHNCSAFAHVRGKTAVVVDFDRFLDSPLREIGRMSAVLDLPQPDQASAAFLEYVNEFLSGDLRHSRHQVVQSDSDVVPVFLAGLYTLLLDFATSAATRLDQLYEKGEWREFCSEFSRYDRVLAYTDRLQSSKEAVERREVSLKEQQVCLKEEQLRLREEQARLIEEQVRLRDELSRQQAAYVNLQQEASDAKARTYSMLVAFDRSFLGRLFGLLEASYLAVRLRRNDVTAYRLLVNEGIDQLEESGSDASGLSGSGQAPGRGRMVWQILAYVLRHPYSSVRLLSVYRLRKLLNTIVSADLGAARSWVAARFPSHDAAVQRPKLFRVAESLDETELQFPTFDENDLQVSIVIPVYNQYRMTISCLQSVLAHTEGVSYEVIVADDGSTDLTSDIEARIHNIHVVRAGQNLGFLKNCNNAVKVANGKYVVLLNNDTNVQPNWLRPLLDVMEKDDCVGLVGPKLLFEDGQLQEAGGIIWQDGSGWNYGRFQDPSLPEFVYLRETDYLSGACILFRRAVWDDLGGFDERFAPAYYEDTDLAFQMRRRGLKVVYQPQSAVVHFEGVSNGTDVNAGVKKHQVLNQKAFVEKWRDVLVRDHLPNGKDVFQARERARGKTTVVFIDHYVPFYDKDAGSRSTFIYLKAMIRAGIIVKFVPANFFPHEPYTRTLRQLGVEVLTGEKSARSWKTWFSDNSRYIDVVYLHRPHVAEDFIDHLVALDPRPKLIYFGHDLHYLRTQREAELHGDAGGLREADDWKQRELAIFHKVDIVYYPSQVEVEEVRRIAPSVKVSAIPLYLLDQPNPAAYRHVERSGLLFVGGFGHPPNEDGVRWFAQEVMPLLLRHDRFICLHIVGSSVPDSIRKLASGNIQVHGFLSDADLAALYQKVRICVVPLRFGAGVKGKVLEALQAGLPICTTPIGAEGIPDAASVMAIEDDPVKLADRIWDLYQNQDECLNYLNRYPTYIQEYFSPQHVQRIIERDFLN